MGDIGTGEARKFKDRYHAHKCEVLALLSTHVKVKMLEGEAKGLEHKYLYKDFTVTQPVNREPVNREPDIEPPPLPPPNMTPVEESAIVGSTGPASSSTGPAFEGTAAAEGSEAAAVEQAVNTMDDIFNAAFPE